MIILRGMNCTIITEPYFRGKEGYHLVRFDLLFFSEICRKGNQCCQCKDYGKYNYGSFHTVTLTLGIFFSIIY